MLVSFVRMSSEMLAAPIAFPPDGGIVDVTGFGAVPGDGVDDTEAIQRALDAHPNGNRIVYLPAGEWIVTDTLRWPDGPGGNAQKRTILQGAGENYTTLRLPASSPGFTDASDAKALIWTGGAPAQRFRNAVRDLAIEVGGGNAGAIALQFNASNQGTIRNLTLRAAPGAGHIGLDLGHCNEIGPLLVRHLTVEGFAVGISTKWPVNSNTFEHVTLRGQRRFGWWNYHQMVFVRGLLSENGVPAIYNEKDSWGTVTLVDSELRGVDPDPATPGILNQRQMALRNVTTSGYALPIDHADKGRDKGDVAAAGTIAADTSHANVEALFREIPDRTFATAGTVANLPVKETPEIPWGDPLRDWANIISFGGDPTGETDSSAALQRAIDSGSKTVYLPAGANFMFGGEEVLIRGPVERIVGLEGRFFAAGEAGWTLADGGHPGGLADAPAVIIERMSSRSGGDGVTVRHESARTLVVSSVIGVNVEGQGDGDIFLDDFCARLNLNRPGQSAWCRQINTESTGTMLRNNGGRLWVLGMKTEKVGTVIETVNGGVTDATGVFVYSNRGWDADVPAFVIRESTASLIGLNERNYNGDPVSFWVEETQDGVTRELRERAWVYLSR